MTKVPNAAEILRKISAAWLGCPSVTDRQTDNGQAIAYSERERKFSFAKNAGVDIAGVNNDGVLDSELQLYQHR